MSQNGEKAGYRVILLLVVGLTAFSSAMKELNQLQQFTLDTSRLVAQWSAKFAPAEVPSVPQTAEVKQTVAKVESCGIKQSLPSVELPWLSKVVRTTTAKPRAIVPRPSQVIDFKQDLPKPGEFQIANLKKFTGVDIEPVQFEFKTRKQRDIRINTRDREMLLKTLNRSINLRFAS